MKGWLDVIWGQRDWSRASEFAAEDMITHGIDGQQQVGLQGFHDEVFAPLTALFAETRIELDAIHTVKPGFYGLQATFRAVTHGGKSATFGGTGFVRFNDDHKLAEGWNQWDFLSMMEQIGEVPMGCMGALFGKVCDPNNNTVI
ncbi:MAG: ester cyclase [Bradymonadia bacterium]